MHRLGPSHLQEIGNGPNKVSESTVSNTELSELFGPHRVPGRELSEFLSAYYFCVLYSELTEFFSQNSPSLPQNSVSPLSRKSTLETVFHPYLQERGGKAAALSCDVTSCRLQCNFSSFSGIILVTADICHFAMQFFPEKFRSGVGWRRLAPGRAQNTAKQKRSPELCPPSHRVAIPGSPFRGQNWKIGKMTFLGSKNAFLGVPLGTI